MTSLLLDIGNTQIKAAGWDGQALGPVKRVPRAGFQAQALLSLFDSHPASIQALGLDETLKAELETLGCPVTSWSADALLAAAPGLDCSAYAQHPEGRTQLGVDRVANLLGAQKRFPGQNVLVLDFGTALTIDALDAEGRYWGGVILPGLWTFTQALTKQVPAIASLEQLPVFQPATAEPHWIFGTSTQAGQEAALLSAYVGGVYRSLGFMRAKLKQPVLVGTGGDVSAFQAMESSPDKPEASMLHHVLPELTLEGLAGALVHSCKEPATL